MLLFFFWKRKLLTLLMIGWQKVFLNIFISIPLFTSHQSRSKWEKKIIPLKIFENSLYHLFSLLETFSSFAFVATPLPSPRVSFHNKVRVYILEFSAFSANRLMHMLFQTQNLVDFFFQFGCLICLSKTHIDFYSFKLILSLCDNSHIDL